ncbi:MAG TPA: hypothetical protein VKZ55_01155 [Microthrixaceae bacterium]|nr:hypothetical protein [Microthrixaceae bacterium]
MQREGARMQREGGGLDVPVEFVVRIRGREATCRFRDGRLEGDPELVRRIRRLDPVGMARDAVSVARLVRAAVGSEVTIRALTS